ncbi:hypothetical protein FQZ97_1134380 [compost metagenome]
MAWPVAPALVRQAARLEVRLRLRPRAGTRWKLAQKPQLACARAPLLRRYAAACRRAQPVAPINDMAEQIATADEEQSSVTEEAAQTLEQSTQASRHLSERSSGLAQLAGRSRG